MSKPWEEIKASRPDTSERRDGYESEVERITKGVQSFADEMRAQGIHVGMGRPPHCLTCGDLWPCESSQTGQNGG